MKMEHGVCLCCRENAELMTEKFVVFLDDYAHTKCLIKSLLHQRFIFIFQNPVIFHSHLCLAFRLPRNNVNTVLQVVQRGNSNFAISRKKT